MAFSSLQPHIKYFDVYDVGYISYTSFYGKIFVLSNPICDEKNIESILGLFLDYFPRAFFVQIGKNIVDILHEKYGFYGTNCGQETRILLNAWNLSGRKKNVLRTAINNANLENISIHEENKLLEQTHSISIKWLKTRRRKAKEIRFLIRPLTMPHQKDVRYFYAYSNEQPIGFVFFDPIYSQDKILGYVPNISRSCIQFKSGLWYVIMAFALNKFKEEGVEFVDLGIMPMDFKTEIQYFECKITRILIEKLYQYGSFFFNFKGLKFAKSRFQGTSSNVFYGHKNSLPIFSILILSRFARFF